LFFFYSFTSLFHYLSSFNFSVAFSPFSLPPFHLTSSLDDILFPFLEKKKETAAGLTGTREKKIFENIDKWGILLGDQVPGSSLFAVAVVVKEDKVSIWGGDGHCLGTKSQVDV
jgi:hypothetical protein